MSEQKKKSRKIGQLLTAEDKKGNSYKYIRLGQEKNKDPKYNFKVQVRILDNDGKVVWKGENPRVWMNDPHENAPKFVLSDLNVTFEEN